AHRRRRLELLRGPGDLPEDPSDRRPARGEQGDRDEARRHRDRPSVPERGRLQAEHPGDALREARQVRMDGGRAATGRGGGSPARIVPRRRRLRPYQRRLSALRLERWRWPRRRAPLGRIVAATERGMTCVTFARSRCATPTRSGTDAGWRSSTSCSRRATATTTRRCRTCRPAPRGSARVSRPISAVPDAIVTIEDRIIDGDRIAARWAWGGTNAGEILGRPPTGRAASITGCHLFRFEGDRIAETWAFADTLGLLAQLGLAQIGPVPATVAS